jgi:hypothetical protein
LLLLKLLLLPSLRLPCCAPIHKDGGGQAWPASHLKGIWQVAQDQVIVLCCHKSHNAVRAWDAHGSIP